MEATARIPMHVHHCYWELDLNCATTVLKILAEGDAMNLSPQLLDAALGLHGAGGYGAQCGLVEGSLMFIGLWGSKRGWGPAQVAAACRSFADAFENRFGSLQCRILRPQGFTPENPPHLCERLTCEAAAFTTTFIHSLAGR
jgi:C_GCAxxG_C_C family probable redox protein